MNMPLQQLINESLVRKKSFDSVIIISVLFQAKLLNICVFKILKCWYLLGFFLISDSN